MKTSEAVQRELAYHGLDPKEIKPLHEGNREDLLLPVILTLPPPYGLGKTANTLTTRRSRGLPPRFVKIGSLVAYRRGDVLDYLAGCTVQSAAQGRLLNRRAREAGVALKAATEG